MKRHHALAQMLGLMIVAAAFAGSGVETLAQETHKGAVIGHAASAQSATSKPSVYAPYEFLIGEWAVGPEGNAPPVAVSRFSWGPGKSYIWFSTSLMNQGVEVPHFEGLLLWNGVRKNLDMLVTLDLNGGRSQEQGDLSIEPDGTVVRRITAYFSEGLRGEDGKVVGPGGATAKFRQTFKPQGANTMLTTVMRETPTGWVATFPGSDKLVMTRRSNAR